jgi:hypothetical protein
MADTEFATWVLGIVSVLVIGGVGASVKTAVDVAVIKQILREGAGRMDRLEVRMDRYEAEIAAFKEEVERKRKRHSERINDMERPQP